jgi:hypothetical protein
LNRIEAAIGVASRPKETIMSNKTKPTHRIFAVTKQEDGKSDWFELGAAWAHQDGQGFNLKLKASPPPGAELVMRAAKTKRTTPADTFEGEAAVGGAQ